MRIATVLFGIMFIATTKQLSAQYESSDQYNLGALVAHGSSAGPAVDQSSLYEQGTYYTRTNALAFTFNFTTVSHKGGLRPAPVFSVALGASSDKFMGKNLGGGMSNVDGVWGHDMGLLIDWKVGVSLNYCLPKKETTFGIRYFNWYQGNVFGGTYSNADDAATIGLTVNWKKLGLAYSFGSDKIPGVLVNAQSWNSSELEVRYQLKYNDETNGGIILGIRGLSQKLLVSTRIGYTPDTRGNLISFFVLFH